MNEAFLLKLNAGSFDEGETTFPLPTRAFPSGGPERGDIIFFWHDPVGLVAEARVYQTAEECVTVVAFTMYSEPLSKHWLDNADREKTTIRSKIRCDRHPRLWFLTPEEISELDWARRFGWDD